jgi:hypothetical protein
MSSDIGDPLEQGPVSTPSKLSSKLTTSTTNFKGEKCRLMSRGHLQNLIPTSQGDLIVVKASIGH